MQTKTNHNNYRSKVRWGIVGVFVLLIITIYFNAPHTFNLGIKAINDKTGLGLPSFPEKGFNLGLDLKGGAQLTYSADVKNIAESERAESVEGVKDVIERRVNGLGVAEPTVQTTKVGEDYRINVELPGVADVEQAIKMIGGTPILEFKEENTEPQRELTVDEKKEMDKFNNDAKKKADDFLKQVKNADDFDKLAKESSEDTTSKNNGGYLDYVKENTTDPEIYKWATTAKEGEISKSVIKSFDGYNILKKGKERDGEEQILSSHILICYLGSKGCENAKYTKQEAENKAKEIFSKANASNFAELAKENSDDPGSKENGGDLGFAGKGVFVKPFEDALFVAKVGEIIGPVETDFGYHIIYKKEQKKTKEYETWRILIKTKSAYDIVPPQDSWMQTGLSGKQLKRAEVVTNPNTGAVQVALSFNDEGKILFEAITQRNLGKPVAIFLDGSPISVPNVNSVIRDGNAVIEGNFTLIEARQLAQRLNAGALPVPVELIAQQTVGASLGNDSLQKSLYAGIIGTILILIFMLLYYRLPGLLSVISLGLYISLTLAIFKIIGVTLTLSGIAGFILSVGMAVDANVLIFERLKEELKQGKSLRTAVEEGFKRAWTSIRDSNISTILSCIFLIGFGSGFVKGFAITLTIGVLVSMFTAITVTRVMLRFVIPWFKEYGNKMFLGAIKHKEE